MRDLTDQRRRRSERGEGVGESAGDVMLLAAFPVAHFLDSWSGESFPSLLRLVFVVQFKAV